MERGRYIILTEEQKKLFTTSIQQSFKEFKEIEVFCINPELKEFSLFGLNDGSAFPLQYFKNESLFNQLLSA